MRRLIATAAALAAAFGVGAASAPASGPAAPGKLIDQVTCGGDTYTVSIQRGDSNGTGQIVGQKGHGIPVGFAFDVVDLTTGTTIFSGTDAVGGGHAHPNQATTTCSLFFFEGPASEFFGTDLPPGVAADDIISATGSVDVILKL